MYFDSVLTMEGNLKQLTCLCLKFKCCEVEGLGGDPKVRGVNLVGWLVVEGWIKPSLFDEMPNRDMLDGTEVQFRSVTFKGSLSHVTMAMCLQLQVHHHQLKPSTLKE